MEIDQNKTCQLLGQMRPGHSSNMELESHILGTPDLRGRKNTIFIVSICFSKMSMLLKINCEALGKGKDRVRQGWVI